MSNCETYTKIEDIGFSIVPIISVIMTFILSRNFSSLDNKNNEIIRSVLLFLIFNTTLVYIYKRILHQKYCKEGVEEKLLILSKLGDLIFYIIFLTIFLYLFLNFLKIVIPSFRKNQYSLFSQILIYLFIALIIMFYNSSINPDDINYTTKTRCLKLYCKFTIPNFTSN